jgi:hypothetical protein
MTDRRQATAPDAPALSDIVMATLTLAGRHARAIVPLAGVFAAARTALSLLPIPPTSALAFAAPGQIALFAVEIALWVVVLLPCGAGMLALMLADHGTGVVTARGAYALVWNRYPAVFAATLVAGMGAALVVIAVLGAFLAVVPGPLTTVGLAVTLVVGLPLSLWLATFVLPLLPAVLVGDAPWPGLRAGLRRLSGRRAGAMLRLLGVALLSGLVAVPAGALLTFVLPGFLSGLGGIAYALGEAVAFTLLALLVMAVQAGLHVAYAQADTG